MILNIIYGAFLTDGVPFIILPTSNGKKTWSLQKSKFKVNQFGDHIVISMPQSLQSYDWQNND